ncbi:MAG: metallophosphoesterase [Pseudomonadota bacterium]
MGPTLFTFGLITDTHIRPPQGDDSSPYAVNQLANDRARYASELLASRSPEFTLHLGDMVHTLPHMSTYPDACQEAHRLFQPLNPKLYFVPGNHDIGDKPMATSPAGAVDEHTMLAYQSQFGESWFSFTHSDCCFAVVNSSLINAGNQQETEQREWLENLFEFTGAKRMFLCSHYPPFINHPDEPSHYDNYAEPGRSWLLELLKRYDVEAVFSGHVHQFFYNCYGVSKLYCLPPTSFTRQDYAELYRTTCEREFGRDDAGKFSVALVHVSADGHSLEVLPTQGRCLADDEAPSVATSVGSRNHNLCVHMRHAWYEAVDLPYNGPMEEFSRKRARNDYPLLRLWQMGISHVRTPLADLLDPAIRSRVLEWSRAGIDFTFATSTSPREIPWDLLEQNAGLIRAVEFATKCDAVTTLIDELSEFAPRGFTISLTKIHTSADEKTKGTRFAHNVSSGFLPGEIGELLELLSPTSPVSHIVYQINLNDDMELLIPRLLDAHTDGITPIFNVRFASRNPAVENVDDELIASRVESVLRLSEQHRSLNIQIDTFMDIDRGYSPRNGLLDRSSNFRKAGTLICTR